MIWLKKSTAQNLKRMLRMIENWSLEDLEMEVEEQEENFIVVEDIQEEDPVEMEELGARYDREKDLLPSPCIVNDREERFMDIKTMMTFWSRQEKEETTPKQEMVSVRRRRSKELEDIVTKLGLEQTEETTRSQENISTSKIFSNSKLSTTTIFQEGANQLGQQRRGSKRSRESESFSHGGIKKHRGLVPK